jgi:hypothetical protein
MSAAAESSSLSGQFPDVGYTRDSSLTLQLVKVGGEGERGHWMQRSVHIGINALDQGIHRGRTRSQSYQYLLFTLLTMSNVLEE